LTLLWLPITLIAALAQTFRNATQSRLTAQIGAAGATQVRFLYGLPFGLLFLAIVCLTTDTLPHSPTLRGYGFLLIGAVAQILGTALMLLAMRRSGFALTTALLKLEPILVAVFGFVVLGDPLTWPKFLAILLVIGGVLLLSRPALASDGAGRAFAYGIIAGGLYGIAAIGFRGTILSIPEGGFVLRASSTLALSLAVQSAVLGGWLLFFDRQALLGSLKVWKQSLAAGFLGAFASQFWFLGFSLTSAANVRTLALIEVPMAQIVSRKLFAERLTTGQKTGLLVMLAGLVLLIWSAG
jgi:drug/metabolite transporter (DMT)-like permease